MIFFDEIETKCDLKYQGILRVIHCVDEERKKMKRSKL